MKLIKLSHFSRYLYIVSFISLLASTVYADIVTDGTVGEAQTLNGPAFVIPESLGSRTGANLFHSFQRFNIANGEQATFTGSASIANVVSRVTGGQISNINGLLRSTIGQSDFYFLNPAGVLFGANAQIDVPGSFYLSTADELRFADGSVYSASNPAASTLTIDQPEAFGFLDDQTANIVIQQSNLGLTTGKTFSVSSNEILIDSTQIQIDAGNVQLLSIGNEALQITVSGDAFSPVQGNLIISNSTVDVSGAGAGQVLIRSGASQISGSTVSADNLGVIDADLNKGIDVIATTLDIDGSQLTANTIGQGLNAADITLKVNGKLSISNASGIGSLVASDGNAGNILINGEEILIDTEAAVVNNVLNGSGSTGAINIIASGTLLILNSGQILSSSIDADPVGKLMVQAENITLDKNATIFSTTSGTGEAGVIEIRATESLNVFNESKIISSAELSSTGNTGNLLFFAKNMTLDGQGALGGEPVVIGNRSLGDGNVGTTQIIVEESLNLVNGAVISNDTFFNGHGGEINIRAESLTLTGNGFAAGLSSSTTGSNDAGKIVIDVSNLKIFKDSGVISAAEDVSHLINHSVTGNAGQISIHANNIIVDDGGVITIETEAILAQDRIPLASPASINIDAQNFTLTNASITTESVGNVPAGEITLNVRNILNIDPSTISTAANNANGGDISIQANIINLQDSQIITSVTGQGNGGDISLNSNVLVLDSGIIQANTTGTNAIGGDIQINTPSLVTSQNIIQTGGDTPLSAQPGLNLIQAAAADGVSGNINITSPQLNISGDLTDLDIALPDVDQLAKNPCTTVGGRQSRLVSLGHGGLPETPDQAGAVVINSERLEQLLPVEHPSDLSVSNAALEAIAQNEIEC